MLGKGGYLLQRITSQPSLPGKKCLRDAVYDDCMRVFHKMLMKFKWSLLPVFFADAKVKQENFVEFSKKSLCHHEVMD